MNKLMRFFLILAIVPALVLTSCKKDETFNSQNELITYLKTQNLDISTIISGFVVGAPPADEVATFISSKYIIDIRSADEFAQGHIEGAIRVDLKNILIEAEKANSKPIVVVCKTGQTATHAVALLRLSGYTTATALKWGDRKSVVEGNSVDVGGRRKN